ncbi:hypothetical protein EDB80DRAFT_731349 [Ilyonectria destructans]|nr:hypothetical protein EDB80DRAFT_731349 [Ilyonectria destructans]
MLGDPKLYMDSHEFPLRRQSGIGGGALVSHGHIHQHEPLMSSPAMPQHSMPCDRSHRLPWIVTNADSGYFPSSPTPPCDDAATCDSIDQPPASCEHVQANHDLTSSSTETPEPLTPSDEEIPLFVPSRTLQAYTYYSHNAYCARPSMIKLPSEALKSWNETLQREWDVELNSIRSIVVRKCGRKSQVESKIEKPELRLSGRAATGSNGVNLSLAVWILCGSGWCRDKVKKKLRELSLFQSCHWQIEVQEGASVYGAIQDSVPLQNLDLGHPIRLREDTELYLHVETPEDNESACGRLVCSTIMTQGVVAEQRLSRLGGRINIADDRLVVTTAHGMLEHLMAVPQSSSSTSESSGSSNSDEFEESDTEDEDCTADSGDGQQDGTETCEPHRDRLGYKNPEHVSSWTPARLGGPVNFLGMGTDALGSDTRGSWSHLAVADTDFALLEAPELNTAKNTYAMHSNQDSSPTWVRHFPHNEGMMSGPVKVLVDDDQPENGFILPQSSSISVQGITVETQKVELREPLARGTSGSWVVRGETLCGMIIAIYDHEPFAQLITAEKLCMDIKGSYRHLVDVSLPFRADCSRPGDDIDLTSALDLATYTESAYLLTGHLSSCPDPDTKPVLGDVSAGMIAKPQSDRGIRTPNRGHDPQESPRKSPPAHIPTKSNIDVMQYCRESVESKRALELQLEARNYENQRLREFNDQIVKELSDYKAQANAKIQALFIEFESRYKVYESKNALFQAMGEQAAEMKGKMDASEVLQEATATEVEKLKQQLKSSDAKAQAGLAAVGKTMTVVMVYVFTPIAFAIGALSLQKMVTYMHLQPNGRSFIILVLFFLGWVWFAVRMHWKWKQIEDSIRDIVKAELSETDLEYEEA